MENCICEKCPDRFKCFTSEKVFSNPRYQGLYEAEMGLGKTKEQAIESVKKLIKNEEKPYPVEGDENWDKWNDIWKDSDMWKDRKKWIDKKDKFKDYYTWCNKDK